MATVQHPDSTTGKKQMTTGSADFDADLDSVSDVDREPLNGGMTETNWKDARKEGLKKGRYENKGVSRTKPQLEDGAD